MVQKRSEGMRKTKKKYVFWGSVIKTEAKRAVEQIQIKHEIKNFLKNMTT